MSSFDSQVEYWAHMCESFEDKLGESVETSVQDMIQLGSAIRDAAKKCKTGQELLKWGKSQLDEKLGDLAEGLIDNTNPDCDCNADIVEEFVSATDGQHRSSFKAAVEYGVWSSYLNGLLLGLKHKNVQALDRWLKTSVDAWYDLYEQMTGY